jgi:nitroimidazol reductase NimA-like FMN-containing flavoprotein (pyridoxamine 5'-phosphate oxidase superfamily)
MSAMKQDETWRGKIGPLEREELDRFLAEGHIARVACLDENGWPYVVPCWHEWDGEGFWVIPRLKSVWAKHLKNDARCALTVDESGTLRKVVVQGEAKLVEDPNLGGRWVEIASRMSIRYLGKHGPKYLEPTLGMKRWLFYIQPVRMWTWQGVDWARRYKVE